MAEFLHHESCPKCGSRDNLGRYSDGSGWCFGCHHIIPISDSGSLYDTHGSEHSSHELLRLPPDSGKDYPQHVVSWLDKYEISVAEAIKWGWVYSPYYDQLIFPFYEEAEDGKGNQVLSVSQARNFDKGRASKRKYYNQGSPADILPIFSAGQCRETSQGEAFREPLGVRRLVVVEDVVSAAKIARQSDAMPLLGSYLPARKIVALKRLYDVLIVWLDADKLKEAREIAQLAKWLGMSTKVVYTELDPKEYTNEEIAENLK